MGKLYKIKFIKDTELKKVGDIANASKKSAESAVNEGYAVYFEEPKKIVKEPKPKPKKIVEEPKPKKEQTEEKSKERYECGNCKDIISFDVEKDVNTMVCSCGKQEWKFLSREFTDKEFKEFQQKVRTTYDDIVKFIIYWMDIPESFAKVISLWIIGTYMHDNFNTFPFLFLNAMRGSGKTRLLRIISHLSKGSEGDVQTGLTESVLFRSPKGETLVLDEFENASSKEKANLRTYLNACYKKGGVVKRTKKVKKEGEETYEVDKFEPFKPIAMANIAGMEDVLGDRCLTLIIDKSNDLSKIKLVEDFSDNYTLDLLKRTLSEFSVVLCGVVNPQENIKGWNNYIKSKYSITPPTTTPNYTILHTDLYDKINNANIDGRNFELLIPIFLIADYLGDDVFDEILEIGSELTKVKKEDEFIESRDIQLVDYVSKLNALNSWKSIKDITFEFRNFIDVSAEDDWANQRWVGMALKRLNLRMKKRRVSKGIEVILDVEVAKEKIRGFNKNEEKT